jgi:hypothetical protein
MQMLRNVSANVLACLITILIGANVVACRSRSEPEITKVLAISDVKTGWYDAGVENGMNKLVPTVILTLKNAGGDPISNVQLNAVIRRVQETEEWGGAYVKVIGANGLPPGASTKPIVLRSNLGYTGIEPRSQMLKNTQFRDAHVQVFVKHGGEQYKKLGEWPVARELLTQ